METPKKLHHKNKKYYLQYHQANILQFLTFLRYKLQRVFSKKNKERKRNCHDFPFFHLISTKVHAQYDPIRMIHSCRKVSTFLPCSFYEHDTRDSTNPSQIEGLLAAETGIFKLLPATPFTIISSVWLVWGEATHTCRFSSRKDARSKVVIKIEGKNIECTVSFVFLLSRIKPIA